MPRSQCAGGHLPEHFHTASRLFSDRFAHVPVVDCDAGRRQQMRRSRGDKHAVRHRRSQRLFHHVQPHHEPWTGVCLFGGSVHPLNQLRGLFWIFNTLFKVRRGQDAGDDWEVWPRIIRNESWMTMPDFVPNLLHWQAFFGRLCLLSHTRRGGELSMTKSEMFQTVKE